MKKYLEKQQLNDYSIGLGSIQQNQEYQLNQYQCFSPMVYGNRLPSPSPFRSGTSIQGQISSINQSRRESAFSKNSDNFDYSVKEKSKIINNHTRQTQILQPCEQDQSETQMFSMFNKEQIIIEEQETLHAKLRMIRDEYNFKVTQLEDQYLRRRTAIMQNLKILLKEESHRLPENTSYKQQKQKSIEIHSRTDSIAKQDLKNNSQQKYLEQEAIRATTIKKETKAEFTFENREVRIDSRRDSHHDSIIGLCTHQRKQSTHKSMKLRESRMKREESVKFDSFKEEQPLKSALKKKDSNRQIDDYNDDSQDDWKFIKEAKNNLVKQKTLDDKQSPNKVRFVNEKSGSKKKEKIIKSKYINDIDVFLKCRY